MMRLSGSSWVGAALLLGSALLWYETFDEAYQLSMSTSGRGPVFFPRMLLTGISLLALCVFLQGLREQADAIDRRAVKTTLAVMALTAAYIVAIEQAGFLLASIAYTALLPLLLGYRRVWISLPLALVFSLVAWYVFQELFLIVLPSSPWFDGF
jgi:putative tricarboxylic transport membrane protein